MADTSVAIGSTGVNSDAFSQAGGDVRQAVVVGDPSAASVAAVSTAGVLQADRDDQTASATISTLNTNLAGVATALSHVTLSNLTGYSGLGIQVVGTWTGTLSLQGSIDGTVWVTIATGAPLFNVGLGVSVATIATTLQGIWQADIAGMRHVRVTATAAITGSAVVTLVATAGNALVGFDTPLPAGTAAIGSVTVASGTVTANGGTPAATPTVALSGDTGAKTATGNGATQTNANGKGVICVINLGTVSGTTPTAVFKLQGSADSGTTWFDVPGATTASLTATGVYVVEVYPGLPAVSGTATAGSVATVNAVLPRTWRLVWTIGGTTPSFTITNVQVNYLT